MPRLVWWSCACDAWHCTFAVCKLSLHPVNLGPALPRPPSPPAGRACCASGCCAAGAPCLRWWTRPCAPTGRRTRGGTRPPLGGGSSPRRRRTRHLARAPTWPSGPPSWWSLAAAACPCTSSDWNTRTAARPTAWRATWSSSCARCRPRGSPTAMTSPAAAAAASQGPLAVYLSQPRQPQQLPSATTSFRQLPLPRPSACSCPCSTPPAFGWRRRARRCPRRSGSWMPRQRRRPARASCGQPSWRRATRCVQCTTGLVRHCSSTILA